MELMNDAVVASSTSTGKIVDPRSIEDGTASRRHGGGCFINAVVVQSRRKTEEGGTRALKARKEAADRDKLLKDQDSSEWDGALFAIVLWLDPSEVLSRWPMSTTRATLTR